MSAQAYEVETKAIERTLAFVMVMLKVGILVHTFGRTQGFDGAPWIDVFRATHWFEPLPPTRALFNSYHPPLSYLVARWLYAIYPHEVGVSQVLSTVSIIGGFFALRSALRFIGLLWTPAGLWLLYGSASIPLVVWLGIETSYDPMILGWYLVTLALSVRCFWDTDDTSWWRDWRATGLLTLLGFTFAAAMLTKFNALFALGFPAFVVLGRRGIPGVLKELLRIAWPLAVVLVVVAPFYYRRFYLDEGVFFPQPMEWWFADALAKIRAERDAHPLRFLLHMLRWPKEALVGTQQPVQDSVVHSLWLHAWKRDIWLGLQAPFSAAVSDFYMRLFAGLLVCGTLWNAVRWRKLDRTWRALVVPIGAVSALLFAASLYFAYKYPHWEWRVIKGKYISPAALALICCVAAPLAEQGVKFGQSSVGGWVARASLWVLLVFMFVNHLLPVY